MKLRYVAVFLLTIVYTIAVGKYSAWYWAVLLFAYFMVASYFWFRSHKKLQAALILLAHILIVVLSTVAVVNIWEWGWAMILLVMYIIIAFIGK